MTLELVHGKPDQPGFKILDLSASTWRQLIQLAEKNGWEPDKAAQSQCNFSEWYFWDRPAHVKRVDALNLASALDRALEIPALREAGLPEGFRGHPEGTALAMRDPNYSRFFGLSREMIQEFIRFLRRGSFVYAIWD